MKDDDSKGKVIEFPMRHNAVEHPDHYCDGGIETIDFIKAKLGTDGFVFYCLGNVLKYVSRAGKKDDLLQDLQKAQTYMNWAVESTFALYNTIEQQTK